MYTNHLSQHSHTIYTSWKMSMCIALIFCLFYDLRTSCDHIFSVFNEYYLKNKKSPSTKLSDLYTKKPIISRNTSVPIYCSGTVLWKHSIHFLSPVSPASQLRPEEHTPFCYRENVEEDWFLE